MAEDLEQAGGVSYAVLIYRLTNVEKELQGLDRKIDAFIQYYPSREVLDLILKPYTERLMNVEGKFDKYKEDKDREKGQLRLVIYGSVLSPILSAILALIIGLAVKRS